MIAEDIYIRKYDPQTQTYQLTDLYIEFPGNVQNALMALGDIFKSVEIYILRNQNKHVTNKKAEIEKYLWKDESSGKYYLTVKLVKISQPEKKIYCWTLFVSPSSKIEKKFLMVNLNSKLKYSELLQTFGSVIDKEIKFFDFKIPPSSLQILAQTTTSGQKIIPLTYNEVETLENFLSANGNIIKIEVRIVVLLVIQYRSKYTLKIQVSKKIKDVFKSLSQTQLTFNSDNFEISSRKQEKVIPLSLDTELFEIFQGETIQISLTKTNNSFDFLAFNDPIEEFKSKLIDQNLLTSFVSWYQKDETLLNLIKNDVKSFSEEWRKLTFDGFKRGFSGKDTMNLENMQQKLAKEIKNLNLWNSSQLGNNFINYYLLERCNSFAKLLLGEMLRNNFPLPTHLFEDINKKLQIIEENIFLTTPGVTVMSIQLSPPEKKNECLGKSTLLNKIFYTAFSPQQNRHPTLNSIPEVMFQIFKDTFPFNIIDIPKQVDPQEQKRLLKGANIILLNSWQEPNKTSQKVKELVKTYDCYVLVLLRDRIKQTTQIQFSYELKEQQNNILNVPNLMEKKDFTLYLGILSKLAGNFILQVSRKMKEQDHSKIYKIYDGTKYIEKFRAFTLIMDQMIKQITKLQTKKNEPIHPLFQKMLKFILEMSNLDEQKKFAYVFINLLKKMKSYTEKPYLGLYTIKSELGKNSDLFKNKSNLKKYEEFIRVSGIQLKKIFKDEVVSIDKTVDQNIKKLNERISYIENQIIPNIFSSEIAMRQLLIAQQDIILDKKRNLKEIYCLLNKLQIQRGAPFEIIDGDNLDMPLSHIKNSLNHISGRVCVISILGPQSSGKSTVLNFLFGCNFKASEGRCTKGVYGSYYEISKAQNSWGYKGLLIIDTEGINSQSKSKQFDRQLISFIMSITDLLLITMKGDLDKAVGQQISNCYQNSKKRFANKQMKIMLILNQNNTNDITTNNKEINDFKRKINLNHQIQLAGAFNNLTLNSSHLPFLHEKINFMKFIPRPSFMQQIIQLQKQIVQTMNTGFKNQFLTIDQKMENFSKNWEIVKSFSSIYSYASNEQIELSDQMDVWIVEKTNDFFKIQKHLLNQYKRRIKTQNQIRKQQQQGREKLKEDCLKEMKELSEKIIQSLQNQDPKVVEGKKNDLATFISDFLIKKHYKIIDEYQNIFDKKLKLIEEEKIILNVQQQGIMIINSKAYELRNEQLQKGQKIQQKQLNQIFETTWKKAQTDLQKNLNLLKSLPVIETLIREQYNIQIKKFESKTQEIVDLKNLKQLPALISSITDQNINNQQKILEEITKMLEQKKINLLQRSKKDPIFIFEKGVGKTTALKKYLNIEESYLIEKKILSNIGVQKDYIKKLFTKELQNQLIYIRLLDYMNEELKSYGILIEDHKNLKKVYEYGSKNIDNETKVLGKAPKLQVIFFIPQNSKPKALQKYRFIINPSKLLKAPQFFSQKDLNYIGIKKYLENSGELIQIYNSFVKKQLQKIGLNIQVENNKEILIQNNPKQYKNIDEFRNKLKQINIFSKQIEDGFNFGQNIDENQNYILGFYKITKYEVNRKKKLPEPIIDYFEKYVSADNKQKIKSIVNNGLSVCKHIDYLSKFMKQITNHYQQIVTKSDPQKIMEDIVNKIYEEFRIFDEDFRQMSLQSTSIFQGYCHLYAVYLLISTRMSTQNSQKNSILQKYKLLKQKQKKQFINRASTSQQLSSYQAYIKMRDQIYQYFKKKIQIVCDLTKLNFQENQLKNIKKKQRLENNLEDIFALAQTMIDKKNKKEMVSYFTNKYSKLEIVMKKYIEQKSYYREQASIFLYLDGYQKSVMGLFSAIQNIKEIKNSILINVPTARNIYYDEKNFFQGKKQISTARRLANYFMKILQLASEKNFYQKLDVYEKQQGIKNQMKIRITVPQLNNLPEYEKLLSELKKKQFEISNLFYFLYLDKQKMTKQQQIFDMMNDYANKQKANLKQWMKNSLKKFYNFQLCKSRALCPCCNQICFQQGNHTKHRALYHQVRGWAGKIKIYIENESDRFYYLSPLVCQELYEDENIVVNNKAYTWSSYKNEIKNHWVLPTRQDIYPQKKKKAIIEWNNYGEQIALQNQLEFIKAKQWQAIHITFIVDETSKQFQSSMKMIGDFVNQVKTIQIYNNLNRKNCVLSLILFSKQYRKVYSQVSVDNFNWKVIHSVRTSRDTNYLEKGFDLIEDAFKNSSDKNYLNYAVLITGASDSSEPVSMKRFQPLMKQHKNYFQLISYPDKYSQIKPSQSLVFVAAMGYHFWTSSVEQHLYQKISRLIPN